MNNNIINSSDAFIINLKKDYGRHVCSQNIIKTFNAKIFCGYDCNKINENNYLTKTEDKLIYTMSAKKSKENLLNKFLQSSNKDYLIVFEDDVYLHSDLLDDNKKLNIFTQINKFLKKNKPKLLYFGISRYFKSDNLDINNIIFTSFDQKFGENIELCSGAYGFVISRDMIKVLLTRINNETIREMPFDLYCLSYISKIYPTESFVMNPHLVVPNIESSNIRESFSQEAMWKSLLANKKMYYMPFLGYMIINVINNKKIKISELLIKTIKSLEPLIKIINYNGEQINLFPNRNNLLMFPKMVLIELNNLSQIKYLSAETIINVILNNNSHTNIFNFNNEMVMNIIYVDVNNIVDKDDSINLNLLVSCLENPNKNIIVCDI